MKPCVFITGGAGLIGRAVRAKFLAENYDVISLDLRPHEAVQPQERIAVIDLENRAEFFKYWESIHEDYARITAVIHLAAFYDFTNLPNAHYEELLQSFREWLPRIGRNLPLTSRVILASSMAALAPSLPGQKLVELSPRAGDWQYPASKIKNERALEQAQIPQSKIELVLAGVYTDFCELVPMYRTIERLKRLSLESLFFPGPTNRGLTFVHLDDVANAFYRAAIYKIPSSETQRFLIGQAEPMTYAEIKKSVHQVYKNEITFTIRIPMWFAKWGAIILKWFYGRTRRFVQPWMIQFSGEHFEFDLSHAHDILGWAPTRQIQADLPLILKFAEQNPLPFKAINEARPW